MPGIFNQFLNPQQAVDFIQQQIATIRGERAIPVTPVGPLNLVVNPVTPVGAPTQVSVGGQTQVGVGSPTQLGGSGNPQTMLGGSGGPTQLQLAGSGPTQLAGSGQALPQLTNLGGAGSATVLKPPPDFSNLPPGARYVPPGTPFQPSPLPATSDNPLLGTKGGYINEARVNPPNGDFGESLVPSQSRFGPGALNRALPIIGGIVTTGEAIGRLAVGEPPSEVANDIFRRAISTIEVIPNFPKFSGLLPQLPTNQPGSLPSAFSIISQTASGGASVNSIRVAEIRAASEALVRQQAIRQQANLFLPIEAAGPGQDLLNPFAAFTRQVGGIGPGRRPADIQQPSTPLFNQNAKPILDLLGHSGRVTSIIIQRIDP